MYWIGRGVFTFTKTWNMLNHPITRSPPKWKIAGSSPARDEISILIFLQLPDATMGRLEQWNELRWACGLVVWFSLRVREAAGSIPAKPQSKRNYFFRLEISSSISLTIRWLERWTQLEHDWQTSWRNWIARQTSNLTVAGSNSFEVESKRINFFLQLHR